MSSSKEKVGVAITGLSGLVLGLLGMVIHVWTVVIAFGESGLVGAVLSLMFPALSQIYWGFVVWGIAGTILNFYCLALLAYVALLIIALVGTLFLRLYGS